MKLLQKLTQQLDHNDRSFFNELPESDKRFVLNHAGEIIGEPRSQRRKQLWEMDFLSEPLSFIKWFEDPDYFGSIAYDKDGNLSIYEKWIPDLQSVLDPESGITEFILTGSIGTGKTTVSIIALLYKLYWISRIKDPQNYFGLLRGSSIVFGFYNITKESVQSTGFKHFKEYLDIIPYFRSQFKRHPRITKYLQFPKNIRVISGSQEMHALGQNLICMHLDELNFMEANRKNQAYKLYNSTTTRQASRFMKNGIVAGLACLISSRRDTDDFLEDHIRKNRKNPHSHICEYSLFDVKKKDYSGKIFKVVVGDRYHDSQIFEPDQEPTVIPLGCEVIEVPVELYQRFYDDLDGSIRDLGGKATSSISPLFEKKEKIFACEDTGYVHPFTKETFIISTEDTVEIKEFVDMSKLVHIENSIYVPNRQPGRPRYVHFDLGLTKDSLGIAMVHDYEDVIGDPLTTQVGVDFIVKIKPPKKGNGEIDFEKSLRFLYFLSEIGFNISVISYDGWQSVHSRQILAKRYPRVEMVSIDKNPQPYALLKSITNEKRLHYYKYQPYIDEALNLEFDPKTLKVDHPKKNPDGSLGGKDVADALAGAIYDCVVLTKIKPSGVRTGDDQPVFMTQSGRVLNFMDSLRSYYNNDQSGAK